MTTRTFDRIPGPQHISDQWLVRDLLAAQPTAYDKLQNARIAALAKRVAVLEGNVPTPPAPPPPAPPPPPPAPPPPVPPAAVLWDCPVWLDQGPEGECVGHGWAHALAAQPKPYDIGTQVAQNPTAEHLYERAQFFDGSPPDEQSGASTGGGAKAAVETGVVAAFHWATSVADVVAALHAVGPVVIGVPWYAGMMDVDADGFIHASGAVQGGHEVLVRGHDPATHVLTIRNSWGKAWGVAGDCKITEAEFAVQFANGGDAAVPTK